MLVFLSVIADVSQSLVYGMLVLSPITFATFAEPGSLGTFLFLFPFCMYLLWRV